MTEPLKVVPPPSGFKPGDRVRVRSDRDLAGLFGTVVGILDDGNPRNLAVTFDRRIGFDFGTIRYMAEWLEPEHGD
jgi:hypothetical protein